MSWFKFTVAVFSIGCAILAHGQPVKPVKAVKPVKTDTLETPIKPDTLQDLKAEAERHQAIVAPLIVIYQQAQDKRMECAQRMMVKPLETWCDAEIRDLRIVASVVEEPLGKAVEAKEAYERALRKAERSKSTKP